MDKTYKDQVRTCDTLLTRKRVFQPNKTAILFVDVQKSELTDSVKKNHSDYYNTIVEKAIPNQQTLLKASRALSVETIYTVIESLTLDGRDRGIDHKLSNLFIPKGSYMGEVIDEVKPDIDDIVITKTSSGVFNSTNIEYVLRNIGIEDIIVVGFLTDQCVDMAIRDGADKGFYMTCVSDACATYSKERHLQALRAFGGYCRVMTTNETIANFAN